ncbi:hypothetical protein B0A75_04650 [Flavobacterium oncorhynchi]|uniref:Uncharacterized protein n=1 Tax=Flavobacterium oncorhynchi TaxID=728056 RepID=A0A226I5X5_9FLAO|nr:hypothetical protein [Flavobacterium oncorhynchi]OXB01735.1 hypothetical protein B0A75_04650 [Flavobacterium oncorhynchi]
MACTDGLDFLEKELLSTLAKCSIFSYSEIKLVYEKVKSIDKTIAVLKLSASGFTLKYAILEFLQNAEIKITP